MANLWLRLWHDMPNDPKWRTIARVSKQSISEVLAVYVHILVIASNATERGRTQGVCSEDLASALDLNPEQIDAIIAAMQGRVLDGDNVSGWSKRQVEREDGAAERARRWREAQKEANRTQPNATERNQTPDKDTDTDKELTTGTNVPVASKPATIVDCPHKEIISLYAEILPELPQPRIWGGSRAKNLSARWKWVISDLKSKGKPAERENGLDFFRRMFGYIRDSDFLMGRAGRWSADLGWIVKEDPFAKILQGNYENKSQETA